MKRPRSAGQTWTEEEHRTLVALVRDGRTVDEIGEELGRSNAAVHGQVKRMLPLDRRGGPADRTVAALRDRLNDDPHYDWATPMTLTPPPRPILTPPTVVQQGFEAHDPSRPRRVSHSDTATLATCRRIPSSTGHRCAPVPVPGAVRWVVRWLTGWSV